jgi:ACS family glucarate transporter-like MFS transporter
MNYVFYLLSNWCFLYLVQERHFTVLQSGWLATAPPLGAALGAGLGGRLTDSLCGRYGVRWGYRSIPLLALPAASALLFIAVRATSPSLAVVALALCFACVELTEGAYWAATMQIAGTDTMAATGILNTCGNLGGLIGVPIVAYLSGRGAWSAAFGIGAACAIGSALAWLGIDATRRVGTNPAPSSV